MPEVRWANDIAVHRFDIAHGRFGISWAPRRRRRVHKDVRVWIVREQLHTYIHTCMREREREREREFVFLCVCCYA